MTSIGEWLIGVFLGAIVGLFVGVSSANGIWRSDAIENGAAHYSCDSANGDCVFTWGAE